MEKEEMIKVRDRFKEIVEIFDELIEFEEKIEKGEKVDKKEYESKNGILIYRLMQLNKEL